MRVCCASSLCRARKEAAEGAEAARQESIAALKSELAELKVSDTEQLHACCEGFTWGVCASRAGPSQATPSIKPAWASVCMVHCTCSLSSCCCLPAVMLQSQLSSLQDAHATQLSSQQEASARQLAQQLKTADAIIKELEGAAVSLQNQLAAEVERADGYSRELQRRARMNPVLSQSLLCIRHGTRLLCGRRGCGAQVGDSMYRRHAPCMPPRPCFAGPLASRSCLFGTQACCRQGAHRGTGSTQRQEANRYVNSFHARTVESIMPIKRSCCRPDV